MTDEMIALARRALACKGWRWMSGMFYARPNGSHGYARDRVYMLVTYRWNDQLPILDDHCTIGCLRALVREAMSADTLYTRPTKTGWTVMLGSGKGQGKVSDGATEAEALVVALEAAP